MLSPDLQFLSLRVKNGLVYQNQYFPLDKQGIVSILGDNGVGKSSIWGLVETCIFGSLPGSGGHKGDELVRDDRDASIQVELLRKEKEQIYHINHFRQKGKWNYKVLFVNGMGTPECDHKFKYDKLNKLATCTRKDCKFLAQDGTAHGYTEQKKQVAGIIGLSKEEFEGSVHLTQNNMHVLIDGKPSERKSYISDFFNLDDRYDVILDKAKEERNKVKDKIEELGGLVHTQQTLATEITQYSYQDLSSTEEDINKARNSCRELTEQQRGLEQRQRELEQEKVRRIQYLQLLPESEVFDDPGADLVTMEARRTTLQVTLRDCEQIHTRNLRSQQANAQLAELEAIKRSLETQYPHLPNLLQSGIDISSEISGLQRRQQNSQRQQDLKKEIAGLPQNADQLGTVDLLDEAQRIHSDIQHIKSRAQALKDGKCPTCGTEHDVATIQNGLEQIPGLQSQYDAAMQDLEVLRIRNNSIIRRKELEKQIGVVEEFNDDDLAKLDQFQLTYQPFKKFHEAVTRLSGMQYQPIEDEHPTEEMVREIADCDSVIEQLKSCLQAKQELLKLNYEPKIMESEAELLEKIQRLERERDEAAQSEARFHTRLGELKGQNDRFQRLRSQLDSLNQRLGTLPELRQYEAYWESMVDAFGPKGLRVQRLKSIMDMVISRLPYYTQFLFREKGLSFSHSCDAGNIYINAHRTGLIESEDENGVIQLVPHSFFHDIATFSGGEKKKLSVSLVLTLADCVVRSKKANMLILDEVDANLDPSGQYLFINELLPFLREKYSSIFVISHEKEVRQAAIYDNSWLLEKDHHWTRVTIQGAA